MTTSWANLQTSRTFWLELGSVRRGREIQATAWGRPTLISRGKINLLLPFHKSELTLETRKLINIETGDYTLQYNLCKIEFTHKNCTQACKGGRFVKPQTDSPWCCRSMQWPGHSVLPRWRVGVQIYILYQDVSTYYVETPGTLRAGAIANLFHLVDSTCSPLQP